MSDKLTKPVVPPVVLILGGTTTVARTLARYLLDESASRASFVRLVDRYSVNPATTYIDKAFRSLLPVSSKAGDVQTQTPIQARFEYKQLNLANTSKHVEVFTPSKEALAISTRNANAEGGGEMFVGFDIVFDLTGETGFDRPELIQISNTYQLALSLATTASTLPSSLKPKAYVRLTFPFYEMKSLPSSSAGHTESADLRPDGVRGRWWHETLRGIGRIQGLNFGVIRCGAWYGRGTYDGEIIPRVVVGHVYQYLKEEMKFLYNSDLRVNTIHSLDIAQALYLLSLYLLKTPRSEILAKSAVSLPFTFSAPASSGFSLVSSSKRTSMSDTWKTIPTVIPEKENVKVPLFNIVDDNDSTQGSLAKIVAETWGIKFGFLNSTVTTLVQQFAKTDFSEMVEDVNEMHVEAWSKMLAASDPPIESCPITPFLEEHAFRKMSVCLDRSKAKAILGFKPVHPQVEVAELRQIVKEFQDDRLWPRLS